GHSDQRQEREQIDLRGALTLPWTSITRLGLDWPPRAPGGDPLVHRDGAGLEPRGVALLAEARRDRVPDDLIGLRVRQHGLETVTNLDPELAVLDEHDQQHAVVEPLVTETPLLEEPVRDVLDALALERAEERDRHLCAGGRFALGQERPEPLALGRLQEPRVVVHAAGRSGRQDERDRKDNREEQARSEERRVGKAGRG